MNKKKTLIWITMIGLFLVGGLTLRGIFKPEPKLEYQVVKIQRGQIENTVSSTGTLSAVQTVKVGSQVSGIIDTLFVDYNAIVKRGQKLALLDKTPFEVAVKEAEAGVIRARARLNQAEAELKRNRPLFEKGHLSEMEFLVTQTNFKTAEADLSMAKAALNKAKTNLSYTTIHSPINGTVIERSVEAGQTIAATFQAPTLFIIAEDLTRMQIEANVDESDIGQIKVHQHTRFTVQAYPDKIFEGKVRQIRLSPTTIQNVVNYTVVIDAENHDGYLLPGMTAIVDFIISQRSHVLQVPNSALSFASSLTSKEGKVLILNHQDQPHPVTFSKGISDSRFTEVTGDTVLQEGMTVIVGTQTRAKGSHKPKSSFLMPPKH